ncbi:MAG TPA: acyltransferase [Ktedonobacterales bacterium]|nr:acyltransferase [Ktedonobacterales bacterium]
MVSAPPAPASAAPHERRARLWQALWPLSSGPAELRALDGLRALAALSVIWFHAYLTLKVRPTLRGHEVAWIWLYGATGVHLFFVLSGFLLFLPYARALLHARPLPAARRFYQRRALRILPAYWVCLFALAPLTLPNLLTPSGLGDIAAHLALLHDDFYQYNKAIEGPFWTLAVEAQFYLLLPLCAAGIAVVVRQTRSLARLVGGVAGVMALALALRAADAFGQGHLAALHGATAAVVSALLHATMGTQGKYLEVFAIGMLASVLYVAGTEQGRLSPTARRRIGLALLLAGLALAPLLARAVNAHDWGAPLWYTVDRPTNLLAIAGPWLIGLSYGGLVLGTLWAGGAARALFAWRPLRFIGLVSYSLYLWHLPIITALAPLTTRLPGLWPLPAALAVGLCVAVPFAYMSYQLVERPFLRRRRTLAERAG